MKTQLSKTDRLRMLARFACKYAWAHNGPRNADTQDRIDEAQRRLLRFIERNVDNSLLEGALTFDDVADFDVQSFSVDLEDSTVIATINDRAYGCKFALYQIDDSPPDAKDLVVFHPLSADSASDVLLEEVIRTELGQWLIDNEGAAREALERHTQGRRTHTAGDL